MESLIKGIQFRTQDSNWSTGVMLNFYSLCLPGCYANVSTTIQTLSQDMRCHQLLMSRKYSLTFHSTSILCIFFWISSVWYISALFLCSVFPLRTFLQLCKEDSEDRLCRLLCHQSRQSNVPSTGKRNMKGVCSVVRVVRRPYGENEDTWILELKVVVTLLALYSQCSMFCAQTVKHPIVKFVAVFLSTE